MGNLMRRISALLTVLLLSWTDPGFAKPVEAQISKTVTPLATTDAAAYQIDPAHSGFSPELLTPPLTKKWTRDFSSPVNSAIIGNGRIFAIVNNNQLYALNPANGQTLWSRLVTSSFGLAPAYENGRVFTVSSGGIMQAFNASTGASLWSVQLPNQYSFSSSPTAKNGFVYVGGAGSGGTLYAVNATNGSILWTASVQNGDNSSPVVTDTSVYVAYACNQVYAFAPLTGVSQWRFSGPCSGGGGQTAALSQNKLYTRDFNGNLILNSSNGTLLDTYSASAIPAFGNGSAFFLNSGTLTGVNETTGNILWNFAGNGGLISAPLVVSSNVYIGSGSGDIFAINATTGQQSWSTNIGGDAINGFTAGSGILLVPSGTKLIAFSNMPSFSFYPVNPCRIADSRASSLSTSGLVTGTTYSFKTTGTQTDFTNQGGSSSGCQIPTDAKAVFFNFVAVNVTGSGFLQAWAAGSPIPTASVLNYAAIPNFNIANGIILPICDASTTTCSNDLNVQANQANTQLVIDVVGYFK